MAHADFRGTPTYFAVLKMMISSKNVNQNTLKNSFLFLKKFVKIRQVLEVPPPDLRWPPAPPDPLPRAILPTPTVLLQNVLSLSPFLMKVLRGNF